jgi:ABC-type branched-subunit amino acid transport system substrate-binding protein
MLLVVTGCAGTRPTTPVRIALLAPFEGRYREIGYNALYAARMAVADKGDVNIELLAVDDSGTAGSAADRARALTHDPLVKVVVALGYGAADTEAHKAYGDLPVLIVGNWTDNPETSNVFILSSSEIPQQIRIPADVTEAARLPSPLIGGDLLALEQFRKLRGSLDGVTVLSSGSLPDASFRERYLASAQFAPEPNLLATLSYDATAIALQAATSPDALSALRDIQYNGLNGEIIFRDGWWANAQVHRYRYQDGRLAAE